MPDTGEAESDAKDPAREETTKQQVREALTSGQARDLPEQFQHLDEKHRAQEIALQREYALQDMTLRKAYARRLMQILILQLVVTNAVFVAFAWAGKHWDLSDGDIQVWLGATVVQVVGVVTVVTRHLFPRRDHMLPPAAAATDS